MVPPGDGRRPRRDPSPRDRLPRRRSRVNIARQRRDRTRGSRSSGPAAMPPPQGLDEAAARSKRQPPKHPGDQAGPEGAGSAGTSTTASARTRCQGQRHRTRIALEDLKGIRDRTRFASRNGHASRAGRSSSSAVSSSTRRSWRGVPVVTVDPRNTSRTCPECGHCEKANRKSQCEFECRACGHRSHADLVGARNIGSRARGAVNNPKVAERHRDLPASEYCDKPPALAGGR